MAVQLHRRLAKGLLFCSRKELGIQKRSLSSQGQKLFSRKLNGLPPYHKSQNSDTGHSQPPSHHEKFNYKARRQAWVPTEVAGTGPRHTPQLFRTSRQWSYSSSQALNPLPGSSSLFTMVKSVKPTSYLGKLNSVTQSLYIMKCPFLLKHSASNFISALHKSPDVSSMYQRELGNN